MALLNYFAILVLIALGSCANSNTRMVEEDFENLLNDIESHYIYLKDRNIDLQCIDSTYRPRIADIENETDALLFFEAILNEFHDSHLILNSNNDRSHRLYSPIHLSYENDTYKVESVWHSQLPNAPDNLDGAEIVQWNSEDFAKAVDDYPVFCADKKDLITKTWIANKILAGTYNSPRILTYRDKTQSIHSIDLDTLEIMSSESLLTTRTLDNIGIITINNSLGENELIENFDEALESLMETEALIIDLRNTINGGNTYVARGIMGRFLDASHPYQMHATIEQYDDAPPVERSWIEYVSPRKIKYKNPVYVLVGRWTGSMGEGMAVGFDTIPGTEVLGTKMAGLAGEINYFPFEHRNYGYRIPVTKLLHIDGTPRQDFIPPSKFNIATDKKAAIKILVDSIKTR